MSLPLSQTPVCPVCSAEWRLRAREGLPAAAPPLTRRWRLELGLLLGVTRAEDFRRGLLPPLDLALKGKQVLNILLFQGARCTARSANI